MDQEFNNNSSGERKDKKKTKPKPQPGDPPGYNPGGEKVHITAKVAKRALTHNQIYFDDEVPGNVSDVCASFTYQAHCSENPNEHQNAPVWSDTMFKLFAMMTFKQLVSAAPVRLANAVSRYQRDSAKRILAPVGLLPLFRHFGSVVTDDGDFEIEGHVTLISTFLLRSVGQEEETYNGVAQRVYRNSYGLDASSPECWIHLFTFCKGIVNQYMKDHPITLRGIEAEHTCVVTGLSFESGIRFFAALAQNNPWPQRVIRAVNICLLIELYARNANAPTGNAIPVAFVNQLNAERVVVYNWTSEQKEARFASYYNHVQNVLVPTLDRVFAMQEISVTGTQGGLGQLVTAIDVENAHIDRRVPGDTLEIGYMLSTPYSGAAINNRPFRVDSMFTPVDYINNWLNGMRKVKKSG